MKNLTVSRKLGAGFGIALALMLLSTLLSVFSIGSLSQQIGLYADYTVPNAEHVRNMQVHLQGILYSMTDSLLAEDGQSAKTILDSAAVHGQEIRSSFTAYQSNQRNHDRDADLQRINVLLQEAGAVRGTIGELVTNPSAAGRKEALSLFRTEYEPKIDEMMEILFSFSASAKTRAAQQSAEADASSLRAWVLLAAFAVISTALTVVLIIVIRRSILTPVNEIMNAYQEISRGNLKAQITYESKDELGQMAKFIRESNRLLLSIVGDVIEKFTWIAQGNLRFQVTLDYPGDFQALKNTITDTATSINRTMLTIDTAAEQVSAGSIQVAAGAQALAAGSAEQASSAEELSASIIQIAEQAAGNAANVKSASRYVEETGAGAAAGNEHMEQLTQAMEDIGSSSSQIANITKVIEDIAFQTNILALNAAIEAARAGAAGKGFAVVADEVRNLAAKSAEAAQQTGELIQRSVSTVAKGSELTVQTAQILHEMGQNARRVTESFSQIERSSAEQAAAIEQMKLGLEQVSAVIQTNAATAEENSATSEEMSAQAAALREEVGKFQLDTEGDVSHASYQALPDRVPVGALPGSDKY